MMKKKTFLNSMIKKLFIKCKERKIFYFNFQLKNLNLHKCIFKKSINILSN